MNSAYVYLQIYRIFDDATPIDVDCGGLCGKACCEGDDAGMLLFPGEESVYKLLNPDWIKTEQSEFTYEYNGKRYRLPLATCDGNCDRFQRPLACRIFPLTPIFDENEKIKIIVDPRSKSICPMGKAMYVDDFDYKFVKKIERAFNLLIKHDRFRAFFKEYTKYINEFARFF